MASLRIALLLPAVVLLLASSAVLVRANSCTGPDDTSKPPLPGYSLLAVGFDMVTGKFSPQRPVDLSAHEHCTWYYQKTGQTYRIPVMMDVFPGTKFSLQDSYVEFAGSEQFFHSAASSSSNEMQSNPETDVSISVPGIPVTASTTLPPLLGGQSSSLTQQQSILYRYVDKSYGYSYAKIDAILASVHNRTNLLSDQFVKDLNLLPLDYDQEKMFQFFTRYGTHLTIDHKLGGLAILETEYLGYVNNYQSKDDRQKESAMNFGFFFDHAQSSHTTSGENTYKGKFATATSFHLNGGRPSSDWVQSVLSDPALIGQNSVSFHHLAGNDPRVQQRQERAELLLIAYEAYYQRQLALVPVPPQPYSNPQWPLVAKVFADPNEAGAYRWFIDDSVVLSENAMNDKISSIRIYAGPGYTAYQTAYGAEPCFEFFADNYFGGRRVVGSALTKSISYEELKAKDLNDRISSLRIRPCESDTLNQAIAATPEKTIYSILPPNNSYTPIPAVVTLYADPGLKGQWATVIQDELSLTDGFKWMNDMASGFTLQTGTWRSALPSATATLYANYNFAGDTISLQCSGSNVCYNSDLRSYNMNDKTSSVRIY